MSTEAFPALKCQLVRAPACRFHDAPRDDQSQTGTAVLACHAAVCLLEWLEDTRLILVTDADAGICDRKRNGDTIFVLLYGLGGDGDAAVLGELDRIARQIDQHLPQTGRVAADSLRQFSLNIQFQRQPFLLRAVLEHIAHGVQQCGRVEYDRLKRQRTCFDLGAVRRFSSSRSSVARRRLNICPNRYGSLAPHGITRIRIRSAAGTARWAT